MRPYSTLAEGLERYASEVTPTKKGAAEETRRIKLIRRDPLTRQPMVTISSADIARWRNAMTGRGLAPSTVRNRLAVVSQTFQTAAREWGLRVANPVQGVRLPPPRLGRDRRLQPGEEDRLKATGSPILPAIEELPPLRQALQDGERTGAQRHHSRPSVLRVPRSATAGWRRPGGRPAAMPVSRAFVGTI
jgi:hypothetical protein